MLPCAVGSLALTSALLACCGCVSDLSAQGSPEPRQGPVWRLQGIRDGYCVRFLVEPGAASEKLRDGFTLVNADQDPSLHPALRQVLKAQPEFGSWTPSSVCLYYAEAVDIGARRFSDKRGRKAQLLGIWSLATAERGTGRRRDLALDFFGAGSHLPGAAEMAHIRMHEADAAVAAVPGTGDREFSVKIGKTRLIWEGRAVGDSSRVARPVDEDLLVNGTSGTVWDLHLALGPAWSRNAAGVLSVQGKDALAKALRASPIRFVGPLYRDGGGELRFSR